MVVNDLGVAGIATVVLLVLALTAPFGLPVLLVLYFLWRGVKGGTGSRPE